MRGSRVDQGRDVNVISHPEPRYWDARPDAASELLYQSEHFSLQRRRDAEGSMLVLRTRGEQRPVSMARFEHQYGLRQRLDRAWAVRPLRLDYEAGALLLEDPGGEPLSGHMGRAWEIGRFLRVSLDMTAALGRMHACGLIHKDIKPENFLIEADSGGARLMGFDISSALPRERQSPEPPTVIAGTLAYMAPEQTGRMNRSLDSRGDLYSLGVTFYEMLSGDLPFRASDPMEWVHCHLARPVVFSDEATAAIPGQLIAIVRKLLAKAAEERYQTATALEADLRRCLDEWQAKGCITNFPLTARNAGRRLFIPEKLYGRERDIDALIGAFRGVRNGKPRLMLVSGFSGVGKSSVVNELHRTLVSSRSLFASGKCDQYKRDIPYDAIAQAIQDLVRTVVAAGGADRDRWRARLNEALGANAQLVIDLVPSLEDLLGRQPPVPELSPQDAQTRFQRVLGACLSAFAEAQRPLVLFLDDLQWVDAATLLLIESLMSSGTALPLLLVGAYRSNEVEGPHPLARALERLRAGEAGLRELELGPLEAAHTAQLVAETLQGHRDTQALAQLVHRKTGGNPFFTIHFLAELSEEGLLAFDAERDDWHWDIARIEAKGYTENVVQLMSAKLGRLPEATRDALKQFACVGNIAGIALLAVATGSDKDALHDALWDAQCAGLVSCVDGVYAFAHDRIQEAAYTLIAERERAPVHLAIGRRLAAGPQSEVDDRIFDVVNQYNRCALSELGAAERLRIAALNLRAGTKARASSAYASALGYLAAGGSALESAGDETEPALRFQLDLQRAECEFLTGDAHAAAQRLERIAFEASEITDMAAATCLRINVHTSLRRSDRAVEAGLDYLRHVGVAWSAHPGPEDVRDEYAAMWRLLGERPIESLLDQPMMSDAACRATLDVLTSMQPPALFTDEHLHNLVVGRMARLSLEHGNSDGSCYAYAVLGVIMGPHFGDYATGFRFGKLGADLVERRDLNRFKARAYLAFGAHVSPWSMPLRASIPLVERAFKAARETGDLSFTGYSWESRITLMIAAGEPLEEIEEETRKALAFARRMGLGLVTDILQGQLQFVRTLRGSTSVFGRFDDQEFDESGFERHLDSDPLLAFATCWYWIRKLQARYLAGDIPSAVAAAGKAAKLLWTSPGHFETAEFHFYAGLAQAAFLSAEAPATRPERIGQLRAHLAQLQEWAAHCPGNFADRAALLSAELARIEDRATDAQAHYEAAIRHAQEHGHVQNEALANELYARAHAGRGGSRAAAACLRNARAAYAQWGAEAKVRALGDSIPAARDEHAESTRPSFGLPLSQLDLATVVRVSHAMSSEILLERLVETIMVSAMQHAGAERGILVLRRKGASFVKAEATTDAHRCRVTHRQTPVQRDDLPQAVLETIIATNKTVLIEDAPSASHYSADPYIAANRPRSILAMPLLKQGQLIGLLYLENKLAPAVFHARSAVLEVIALQAAISLENAQLYADVQYENAERARAEQVLAGEKRLLEMIAEARPLKQSLEALCRTVEEVLSGCLASITLVMPDGALKRGSAPNLPESYLGAFDNASIGPKTGPCGVAAYRKKALIVSDIASYPYWDDYKRIALSHGLRACWATPVFSSSHEVVGTFAIFYREKKNPESWELKVIEQYSHLASIAIERAEAESALRRSEERYALAVDASGDGHTDWVVATDEFYASPRFLEICGLPPETTFDGRRDFIGKFPYHPEDRDDVLAEIEAHHAGNATRLSRELRIVVRGEIRWVLLTGLCTRNASGSLIRWNSALTDITTHKRAEAALLESERQRRQAQRLEALGTLAGGIAHDFNNILGAILGFGDMVLQGTEPGTRTRRDMERIVAAGERGRALVDRILAFSRSGVGERVLVPVQEVVSEAINLLAGRFASSVQLDVQLNVGSAAILGDPTQVHQIFANLLMNGAQAMPQGGRLRVSLEAVRLSAPRAATIGTIGTGEYIVLEVADEGIGIAPDLIERIFDPFFTTKEAGGGTGLGLSLVHGIVTEIGGCIDVASTAGLGSVFSVYFPRAGEAAARDEIAVTAMPTGKGERVLILDDEEALVALTSRILADLNYLPVGVTSGTEALALLRSDAESFDAVITDERMPGLSGSEFIHKVRAVRRTMPILLVSGYVSGAVATRAYNAGANEVLRKPLSTRELALALAAALASTRRA